MSANFNDPNFDSRNFNPIRPKVQPGMTFEEHQRIVAAALKDLKPPSSHDTDIAEAIRQARVKIRAVLTLIDQQANMMRASGLDIDRKELWRQCQAALLDRFAPYGKDDLLVILTTFMTELIIKEIA
jgi:hypothetical protein